MKEPEVLAKKLNQLIEGAIVTAHVEGDKNSAERAKKMAKVFIRLAVEC